MSIKNDESHDVESKPGASAETEHIEVVRTISQVPGNPNYHEKDGLRTEGDGVDHTHYNASSLGFIMTMLGCALSLTGSQIVPLLYLTLGTTIAHDLKAPQSLTLWLLTCLIVAMGVLAPFVGPLADMFGRKMIFLISLFLSVIGGIICAAAPTPGGFMAGQTLLGFGAVGQELLAIAVAAEIVPTAKRPLYSALILCAIIPWSPGTLYANWIADSSWRWIGCTVAIWNVLSFGIIAYYYRPPPRVNSLGLTRREMLARIDFVGGILLTFALVFILVGLNWGGQNYPWRSAHVLSFLILGLAILICFVLWEFFGAKYALFPRRIVHAPRPFFCLIFVIFAAGINYVPLVVFWPLQSISVFGSDHHQTGLNALPIGLCILGGSILSAVLIGLFKHHVTLIMTLFCIMQTVGCACLVLIDPHNISTAWAPIVFALVGVGGVLVPNQVIITTITPDDLLASVTALTVGLRSQCQVIGLAIFYNRFVNEATKNAFKILLPAVLRAGIFDQKVIVNMVNALTAMPFDQFAPLVPQLKNPANFALVKEAAIQTFSKSFSVVYYVTIPFGVSACIAAVLMGDVSKYMDNHVAVVL